jgi:hypothetical protein
VASSAVPSVGSALSPSYMLAIDLATTGLKSRNLIVGANVSLIMQYGETTCCQRRSGRVDDEGNDLLLNSETVTGGGGRGGGEQGGGSTR